MAKKMTVLCASASVLVCALGAPGVSFAAAAEAPSVTALDEVIVTARRREERLQDVPVAVTAISAQKLADANIQSISELQRLVPSFTITGINARGTAAAVTIRGQRQNDQVITVDPSVGLYVNEVYLARPQGFDTTAFDLTSVQVLKGPQGTLFGRNTTGGAVLLTTQPPGHEFGGYLKAYAENPKGAGLQGAVDIPLNSWAALRLAANYQYREGYTKVVNTGQHLDDRDRWAGRATLDLTPSDAFRSTFVIEGFQSHENGVGTFAFDYIRGGAGNATIANLVGTTFGYQAAYAASQTLGFHETALSILGLSRTKTFGGSDTTTYKFNDHLLLKNIVGYRTFDSHDVSDQDGTPANVIINNGFAKARQFSEELQLQGDAGDHFNWVTGLYYFVESGFDNVLTYSLRPPLVGAYSNNYFWGRNVSSSAFAHGSYTLPFENRTRIFGGVRYTQDQREVDFRNRSVAATGAITCTVVNANSNCSLRASSDFSAPTWDIGIDYQPIQDSLLYASISHGYRSGGYNGRATSVATQAPFNPEKITNYEVGAKSETKLGTMPAMISADVYYSDYQQIQRSIVKAIDLPDGTRQVVTVLVNAAAATIKGVEVEGWIRPLPNVTLRAHYSYTDAKYDTFLTFNAASGKNDLDQSFNKFAGVSPNQGGVGLDWNITDDDHVGAFRLSTDVTYSDGYELNDFNVPGGRTRAATVVDGSLVWDRAMGSRVTATLYAKNLFDAKYETGGLLLTSALDVSATYHAPPRVIGISLSVPLSGK